MRHLSQHHRTGGVHWTAGDVDRQLDATPRYEAHGGHAGIGAFDTYHDSHDVASETLHPEP